MVIQLIALVAVSVLILITGFVIIIVRIKKLLTIDLSGDDNIHVDCVDAKETVCFPVSAECSGQTTGLEEIADSAATADSVSIFWRPFTVTMHDPELLHSAGNMVIFEKNGIHFIDNAVFNIDKNSEEKLDRDFIKLVNSVASV